MVASGLLTASVTAQPSSSALSAASRSCQRPESIDRTTTAAVPEGAGFAGRSVQASIVHLTGGSVSVTEPMPPAGWKPATATQAELKYFGIPARPAQNSAGYAQWATDWITHYTGFTLAVPCAATSDLSAATKANWAGILAYGSAFTTAYGATTYNPGSTCAQAEPDSYTNWVGLGGYNTGRLIQNGFITTHTGGSYPFLELLNSDTGVDTHTVRMDISGDPNNGSGHTFNLQTQWLPSTSQVSFAWHDITTGQVASMTVGSAAGKPASYFYDSSSGEAIDERAVQGGVLTSLRNFGTDQWSNAYVATNGSGFTAMRSLPHIGITMQEAFQLASVTAGSTADRFTDTWDDCTGE
ncbi:MAG: hypothetical protein M3Y42_09305 [Actinomycetota bacterium]|nr:hypothetical protein [Actinomycetota bacterium]MDQ2957149.1 hypothetical protein [Actinomycetota bacterium]